MTHNYPKIRKSKDCPKYRHGIEVNGIWQDVLTRRPGKKKHKANVKKTKNHFEELIKSWKEL